MRRTVEEAFGSLRAQVIRWNAGSTKAPVSAFLYDPEMEPVVLARFPAFSQQCEAEGMPIELIDVGEGLLLELKEYAGLEHSLTQLELDDAEGLRHNLNVVASRYLKRVIREEPRSPVVCRVLVNIGALATFVSYSAIANEFAGTRGEEGQALTPCVLAFPGDGDERYLNVLRLRADTNYRTPRI